MPSLHFLNVEHDLGVERTLLVETSCVLKPEMFIPWKWLLQSDMTKNVDRDVKPQAKTAFYTIPSVALEAYCMMHLKFSAFFINIGYEYDMA